MNASGYPVAFDAKADERERRAFTWSIFNTNGPDITTTTHFNDAVLTGRRIECILNVAFTNDAKMTNNVDGGSAKHVVIRV